MKRSLIFFVILAAAMISAEELETRKTVKKAAAIDLKNELEARTEEPEVMTVKVEVVKETSAAPLTTTAKVVPIVQESTTEKVAETSPVLSTSQENLAVTSTTVRPSTTESSESNESEGDDNESSSLPPKRKVLYLNQQQHGRLNVHLELSDVSLIVVPKSKDPQLSLLNLLFKSAQKSNMKKKEQEMKVEHHSHDEYSKYKHSIRPSDESYQHLGSTVMPFIESRAPYKVDISSTLGQQSQPAVDIMPNSHQQHAAPQQFARSPIMQLLKPIPYTIQTAPGQLAHSNRIFKRSIDSRLFGIEDEIPSDEDELTESVFNSLDNHEEDINGIDRFDGSEFVLLGATENCGPGRRRNSYQICVAVDKE